MRPELLELNKNTILKYISQEQIFEKYLGFIPDLKLLYKNPLRTDKTPGCSFYYRENSNKLIFHDFAWGVHWDCFDVVQYSYNCNFPKALEKIADDFNIKQTGVQLTKRDISKLPPIPKQHNKLEIKRKKIFHPKELEYWNIGGLNVTEKDLLDNRIFSISHLWEHTNKGVNYYHNLFMTFAFQYGQETFQIYSPLKKKEQRRFINSQGFKIGDLKRLDPKADYVVITKSRKDSFFLRMLGVNACFIINERVYLTLEVQNLLDKYPVKFTLFDNDKTGKAASARFRRDYDTVPLFYDKQSDGKDTYDTLKRKGKDYMYEQIAYYKMYFGV